MLKNDYIEHLRPVSVVLFYDANTMDNGHDNASYPARTVNLTKPAQDASETSFEDLLLRVGETRDKQAFVRVFEYFAPRIKSFLMRGGMAPDQTEELVQETMLAVWHKADNFDPTKAAASTWIYTIARNKKIDFLRKHSRPEPDPNDPFFKKDNEPVQDEALSLDQDAAAISEAMKDLPEEQVALIQKAFFEDKTHQQIAEETGLPLGTVKSRIRLALKKLYDSLDGVNDQ